MGVLRISDGSSYHGMPGISDASGHLGSFTLFSAERIRNRRVSGRIQSALKSILSRFYWVPQSYLCELFVTGVIPRDGHASRSIDSGASQVRVFRL